MKRAKHKVHKNFILVKQETGKHMIFQGWREETSFSVDLLLSKYHHLGHVSYHIVFGMLLLGLLYLVYWLDNEDIKPRKRTTINPNSIQRNLLTSVKETKNNPTFDKYMNWVMKLEWWPASISDAHHVDLGLVGAIFTGLAVFPIEIVSRRTVYNYWWKYQHSFQTTQTFLAHFAIFCTSINPWCETSGETYTCSLLLRCS